ncbi:hypothetical protein FWH58_01990 [Candidatus Saccharibacteria bacterium]|nr:hypothetical protein [Candidatus Saccharibacteria bacterium]
MFNRRGRQNQLHSGGNGQQPVESTTISRRNFLKILGLAVPALVLEGCGMGTSSKEEETKSTGDNLDLLCGNISEVIGISEDQLKKLGAAYGFADANGDMSEGTLRMLGTRDAEKQMRKYNNSPVEPGIVGRPFEISINDEMTDEEIKQEIIDNVLFVAYNNPAALAQYYGAMLEEQDGPNDAVDGFDDASRADRLYQRYEESNATDDKKFVDNFYDDFTTFRDALKNAIGSSECIAERVGTKGKSGLSYELKEGDEGLLHLHQVSSADDYGIDYNDANGDGNLNKNPYLLRITFPVVDKDGNVQTCEIWIKHSCEQLWQPIEPEPTTPVDEQPSRPPEDPTPPSPAPKPQEQNPIQSDNPNIGPAPNPPNNADQPDEPPINWDS